MKFTILAAVAASALAFGTVATAGDFDVNAFTTTIDTGTFEFSGTTFVGNDGIGLGDSAVFSAGATVMTGVTAYGDTDLFVYGTYADLDGTGVAALGAEYTLTKSYESAALAFAVNAVYVAPFDNFDDGEVLVTPYVNAEYDVASDLTVFGEVGYTFVATDSFSQAGGYAELGVDAAFNDNVSLRPSVIMPFDGASDDISAAVELTFAF